MREEQGGFIRWTLQYTFNAVEIASLLLKIGNKLGFSYIKCTFSHSIEGKFYLPSQNYSKSSNILNVTNYITLFAVQCWLRTYLDQNFLSKQWQWQCSKPIFSDISSTINSALIITTKLYYFLNRTILSPVCSLWLLQSFHVSKNSITVLQQALFIEMTVCKVSRRWSIPGTTEAHARLSDTHVQWCTRARTSTNPADGQMDIKHNRESCGIIAAR